MKRKTVLVVLAGAFLTSVAWGQFWNKDGTIAISNSGIVSKGSELDQCWGIEAGRGHSLGTVSFVAEPWRVGAWKRAGHSLRLVRVLRFSACAKSSSTGECFTQDDLRARLHGRWSARATRKWFSP